MKLKRSLLFILSLILIKPGFTQDLKKVSGVYYLPAYKTEINGLAAGLIINSMKESHEPEMVTILSGVGIELIGLGIILPIVPSSPIYIEPDSLYQSESFVDSIITRYNNPGYIVNGAIFSPGGIAGHNIEVNGLNLSGINTLTSKMNGFSTSVLFNISGVVNGVSLSVIGNNTIQLKGLQVGVFNTAIKVNGVQIGLFNSTRFLKGVQIGLWNKSNRRQMPIFNWN